MRERGIHFNSEMVRAVMEGRKVQTRRAVKWRALKKGLNLNFTGLRVVDEPSGWVIESDTRNSSEWRCDPTPCPFGVVGDRLWVRETFRVFDSSIECACEDHCSCSRYHGKAIYRANGDDQEAKWTPSIHMPRKHSRVTLEITGIRVERLNSMTEQDALAEGCKGGHDSIPGYMYSATPHEHFHHVWESIYGEDSWQANPWVWVIEFKRVEGE